MGLAGDGVLSRVTVVTRACDVNAASSRGNDDGDGDGGTILRGFGATAAVAADRLLRVRMRACLYVCTYVSSATRFDLAGQSHRRG